MIVAFIIHRMGVARVLTLLIFYSIHLRSMRSRSSGPIGHVYRQTMRWRKKTLDYKSQCCSENTKSDGIVHITHFQMESVSKFVFPANREKGARGTTDFDPHYPTVILWCYEQGTKATH